MARWLPKKGQPWPPCCFLGSSSPCGYVTLPAVQLRVPLQLVYTPPKPAWPFGELLISFFSLCFRNQSLASLVLPVKLAVAACQSFKDKRYSKKAASCGLRRWGIRHREFKACWDVSCDCPDTDYWKAALFTHERSVGNWCGTVSDRLHWTNKGRGSDLQHRAIAALVSSPDTSCSASNTSWLSLSCPLPRCPMSVLGLSTHSSVFLQRFSFTLLSWWLSTPVSQTTL